MTMEGNGDRLLRLTRRLVAGSAVLVGAAVVFLVGDHLFGLARAPADRLRVERLEVQVDSNAAVASALHEERERQTDASVARRNRGRLLAWIVLAAAAVFVAGGKWLVSLQPPRPPALDLLVAQHDAGAPPATGAPPQERSPSAIGVDAGQELDLDYVDDLVARFGNGREAAIPILQSIQNHYRYLPDAALRRVCERTAITPAQIAGTSTFYAQFRRSPIGRHLLRVCHGTACHVAGADQLTRELRRHLEIPPGADTDPQRRFTVEAVACVGCCSLAPVMMVEDDTAGRLTPGAVRRVVDELEPPA